MCALDDYLTKRDKTKDGQTKLVSFLPLIKRFQWYLPLKITKIKKYIKKTLSDLVNYATRLWTCWTYSSNVFIKHLPFGDIGDFSWIEDPIILNSDEQLEFVLRRSTEVLRDHISIPVSLESEKSTQCRRNLYNPIFKTSIDFGSWF